MRYEGRVFRPPSEAYSLIVQVTVGCSHNKCTFCEMYKEKEFHLRKMEDILEDFAIARATYRRIERIFLADGDALIRKTEDLKEILTYIKEQIPECERVTAYASPRSLLLKSPEDLAALRALGLTMLYMGLESGSEKILKRVNKGDTAKNIVEAGVKAKNAGIALSVTAISGLGGKELWREHAVDTAKALSQMNPEYIGLLTLLVEEGTELKADVEAGRFELLSPLEVLEETYLLLEHIDSPGSVFRMNHASNYLQLRGTLNEDKKKMMDLIQSALSGGVRLKSDEYRAF